MRLLTADLYRAALESCLAHQIREYHKHFCGQDYGDGGVASAAFRGEINGLCMALRMLGGYGVQAFDLAWANDPDRPDVDWETVLSLSYVS